jgi:hypothetical protein
MPHCIIKTSFYLDQARNRPETGTFTFERVFDWDREEAHKHKSAVKQCKLFSVTGLDQALICGYLSAIALSGQFESKQERDNALVTVFQSYDRALELAEHYERQELQDVLEAIPRPTSEMSNSDWQAYAEKLHTILEKHCPCEEYEFTEGQLDQLEKYIRGSYLLKACLAAANISDLSVHENRLLRLPTEGTTE